MRLLNIVNETILDKKVEVEMSVAELILMTSLLGETTPNNIEDILNETHTKGAMELLAHFKEGRIDIINIHETLEKILMLLKH